MVGIVAKNIIGSTQYEGVIEYHQKCYDLSLSRWLNRPQIAMGSKADGSSYTITVKYEGHYIRTKMGYSSQDDPLLPPGVYTIVEESWDMGNNLWGKLESGMGWVCLSSLDYDPWLDYR